MRIYSILINILLVAVCSSISYAQDGQLITLDDGTVVRYFTQDQLQTLATQLEERDACYEELDLRMLEISNLDYQIENLNEQIFLLSSLQTAQEEYIESLDEVTDRFIRNSTRRVLFCRSMSCAYTVGLSVGVVASVALAIGLN